MSEDKDLEMDTQGTFKLNKHRFENLNLNVSYQCSYFKWYTKLPAIVAIFTLVIFFIWGIIDPIVFQDSHYPNYGYSREYTYGVMGLNTGFGCWLVWMLIGIVCALIMYFLGKIYFSQKILNILYLQKLCGEYIEQDENTSQN